MSEESGCARLLESLGYDEAAGNFGCVLRVGSEGSANRALKLLERRAVDGRTAWALRGKLLSDLGRHEEALACLRRAVSAGADGRARAWLGGALVAMGRFSEALQALDGVEEGWARFFQAAGLCGLGEREGARRSLETLSLSRDGNGGSRAAACALLALIRGRDADKAEALKLAGRAVRLSGSAAWAYGLRAGLQREWGRPRAALRDIERLLWKASVPWACFEGAGLLAGLGRWEQAVRYWRKGWRWEQGAAGRSAGVQLAQALNSAGREREALLLFESLARSLRRARAAVGAGLAEGPSEELLSVLVEIQHKRLDAAGQERTLRLLVSIKPGSAHWRARLSQNLSGQGRIQEAVAEARRALRRDPASELGRIVMGSGLLELGRYAQAVSCLEEGRRRHPDSENLVRALQGALIRGYDYRGAERLARAWLASRPSPEARAMLGQILWLQERYREAERELRRAFARRPGAVGAAEALADTLQRQGRLREAEGIVRRAIRRGGRTLNLVMILARLRAARGDAREAIALARFAASRGSDNGLAILADALCQGQRWRQAEDLASSLRRRLTTEMRFVILSKLAFRLRRGGEAAEILRRGIRRYGASDELKLLLAETLSGMGRYRQAGRVVRGVLRRRPQAAEFNALMAEIRLSSGLLGPALGAARRAVAQDSSLAKGWKVLFIALCQKGRAREAVRRCEALLLRRPELAEVRYWLGRELKDQGFLREAERALRGAPAGTATRVAEGWEAWAEACRGLGLWEKAARGYRAALRANPRQWRARARLAGLLRLRDRPGEARAEQDRPARAPFRGGQESGDFLERFHSCLDDFDFAGAARWGDAQLDLARRRREYPEHQELSLLGPAALALPRGSFGPRTRAWLRRGEAAGRRFLARRPDSPWPFYFLAELRYHLGEAPDLEAARWLAARARGRYLWMRAAAGREFLAAWRWEEAAGAFAATRGRSEAEDSLVLCSLAETRLCQGRRGQAERAFEEALRIARGPERGEVLARRGEALLRLGRAREACDLLGRVEGPYAARVLGAAMSLLGRRRQALVALERALDFSPADIEARLWLCETLLRGGRPAEAERQARLLLRWGGARNFYTFVVRGLIRRALGDPRGMMRDCARVPEEVRRYAAARQALETGPELLERVLELSRGVRRGGYERSLWMR